MHCALMKPRCSDVVATRLGSTISSHLADQPKSQGKVFSPLSDILLSPDYFEFGYASQEAIREAVVQKYLVGSSGRKNQQTSTTRLKDFVDMHQHSLMPICSAKTSLFGLFLFQASLQVNCEYQNTKIQGTSSGDDFGTANLPVED